MTTQLRLGLLAAGIAACTLGDRAWGQLIGTVDYSDTFTLGVSGRANGVFGSPGPYAVEDTHGNPGATWTPQTNYSFNDIPGSFGSGPTVLAAAAGNPGAATGMAQSGGGDFSFAYGLRTDYVVEMDAFLSPGDRTDMTSGPSPGGGIFEANSLSVFFRRDSIGANSLGLYNGSVETHVLDGLGQRVLIGVDDDNWHRLAVRFNQDDDRLVIFVDGAVKADLDLTTFAGGIYQNYSNGAVGAGGAGAFVDGKVLWFDNFQVGTPACDVLRDDFERPDMPVNGWTAFQGGWNIAGGELVTGPTAAEHWVWAGNPPLTTPGNVTIEFDFEFLAPGTVPAVGRHGGAMFFASAPTHRGDPVIDGYFLDWIDRPSDRGVRFTRVDNAAQAILVSGQGAAAPAAPPLRYRIEVEGPTIRVFGDGVKYVDLVDSTYRGGHFGFWTWDGGQQAAFDNVCASELATVLAPCIEPGPEPPITDCPVSFDGSCSFSSLGAIVSYEWDLGDGATASGARVQHTYTAAGMRTVTLTVEDVSGQVASASQEIEIAVVALDFADGFERPDGAAGGWTVARGATWGLAGGKLVAGPSAEEYWVWAGDRPVFAPAKAVFEYDYRFLAPGSVAAVGRHGGFQFCASRPTMRTGSGAFSGYFVDWIDRPSDRGVRLTRADNGAFVGLGLGQGAAAPAEPPLHYRVEIDGDRIRVFGDGVQYVEVLDGTYRGGFFGFWTWEGSQQVAIDNLTLDGEALAPCFSVSPALAIAGEPVVFDAGCAKVFGGGSTVAGYQWDFGDGMQASGPTTEHTYEAPDVYTVTLTITDSLGATASLARLVSVAANLDPFADCFDRPAGPVDGWTEPLGAWQISGNGRLQTSTAVAAPDAESWAYAGDPPGALRGDFSLEFEVPSVLFTGAPGDAVGRHFGVYFGDPVVTNRFAGSSGYTFWWIDRASDFGLSLARWDAGALTVLHSGTGVLFPEPPRAWRIEAEGPNLRLFGDGVLAIEVEDETYREGRLAFWVWKNITLQIDSVRIPPTQAPQPCNLAITCTVDAAAGVVHVEGTTSVPAACGAPATCDCEQVEVFLAGELVGIAPGGVLEFDVPLPDSCEPGRSVTIAARCTGASAPSSGAECTFTCPETGGGQIAGDCTQDGALNISDPVCLLGFLFTGQGPAATALPCGDPDEEEPDAGDLLLMNVNGAAGVDIADAVYILNFLFSGGPRPVQGPGCIRLAGCPDVCTP